MNEIILREIFVKGFFISGLIFFLLFYLPVKYFLQKQVKKVKNDFLILDEIIICEPKFNFVIEYILPFLVGGAIGGVILPLYFYQDNFTISVFVSSNHLFLYIIIEIIFIFLILMINNFKLLITNKRIFNFLGIKYLNNIGKRLNLNLIEIDYLEFRNYFFVKSLNIFLKNGECIPVIGFRDLKKIKLIMEQYIG